MMMMKTNKILILTAALALSSCANLHQRRLPAQQPSSHAQIKLAEAANSVSRSLNELARVEREAKPPAKGAKLLDPNSLGIHQAATVDWSGPVEPLLKQIAAAIHYRLRVLGNAPAVPVMITLNAKRAPVANLLRDIDFQTGHKGRIVVYSRSKVVELRYAKA
jgi:defect in organelle trafficking protein DotD